MAIDIPSLFSDIIGTDEQRRLQMLQEGDLLARQLTGNLRTGAGASLGQRLTATAAPTVTAIAGQLPQRREDIRRAAGGMLGLDVRTQGEKVQDALRGIDASDPESLLQAAQSVGDLGLGSQAATIRGLAADVTRQNQADIRAQEADSREQEQSRISINRDLQAISESAERQLTSRQNRLFAAENRDSELSSQERQAKLEKLNLQEAELRIQALKEGDPVDEVFGAPQFYPNGVISYIAKNGDPVVKDINANVLSGDDARAALEEGNARLVEQQQKVYQARRLGTAAAKTAADAFESIGPQRIMITNLREAARLVEGGAATSKLEEFLKPLSQATQFLKQINGELTLSQLSQVTMGALSEKELELLEATAAPSGFDKGQIVQWYRDKAAATEKALTILEEQAAFFSRPGATPETWIESQKTKREAQESPNAEDTEERAKLLREVRGESSQQRVPGTGGRTGRPN